MLLLLFGADRHLLDHVRLRKTRGFASPLFPALRTPRPPKGSSSCCPVTSRSARRLPFNVSCKAGLPAQSSLGFCLSRKVFISPWLLRDNLPGYRILGAFFLLFVNYFPALGLLAWFPEGSLKQIPCSCSWLPAGPDSVALHFVQSTSPKQQV